MGGAFLVSREIFNNDLWNDPVKFRIFFYIMGNAVFSRDGIEHAGMKLERGQYLRSLRNLQDDLSYREGRGNAVKKYPLTTIQRKLKSLEKEEKITMKSTEYGTLFTVLNYALYQGLDNYKKEPVEQQRNSDGTVTEQRWNNNKYVKEGSKNDKEVSSSSPADDAVNSLSNDENPHNMYQKCFGIFPTGMISQQINSYLSDGMEGKVVAAAIYKAAQNGKEFGYARGILNNWFRDKILTYEQVKAEQEQYTNRKKETNPLQVINGGFDNQPKLKDRKPAPWTLDE